MELTDINNAIRHHAQLAKINRRKAAELNTISNSLAIMESRYTAHFSISSTKFTHDIAKDIDYYTRVAKDHEAAADHFRQVRNILFIEV